jgi:hypothetical protein
VPLASVLLFVLGGSVLVAGIAAAYLLPAPGGGPDLWYLVPAFVLGSLLEIAGAALALRRKR